MPQYSVCYFFQSCSLIILFMTAALPLDISPDYPVPLHSKIERDLKTSFKYYDDDNDGSDESLASSTEDSKDEVPQKLSGKIMRPIKSDSRTVVDINGDSAYASMSNETSDSTEHVEDQEAENNYLKDNNHGDKNIYPYQNNGRSRLISKAEDKRNQHIVVSTNHDDDIKSVATLPGLKLSPSEMTKFKIWPEAKILFYIDEFSYDKVLRDKIRGYLDRAKTVTGLNFVELSNPPQNENERWVLFVNRRGQLDCKDYSTKSFTNLGVQKVILGYDCLQNNGPMAAIVLALAGVPPQHNAPNRDKYINVSMESILPEKRGLFKRLDDKDWLFHDLYYDYYSVGHYSSFKYTADGSATITAYSEGMKETLPNPHFHTKLREKRVLYMKHDDSDTYSVTDIQKIRLLYNNILRNLPRVKLDLCKNFYRPQPVNLMSPKSQNVKDQRPKTSRTSKIEVPKKKSILKLRVNKINPTQKNTGKDKMFAILSSIEFLNDIYKPGNVLNKEWQKSKIRL